MAYSGLALAGTALFGLLTCSAARRWSSAQRAGVSPPTVEIDGATITGVSLRSADGGEYDAFRGIPYAEPPVGRLRFQPPRRLSKWPRSINATHHGSVCLQNNFFNEYQEEGQEDCLFLNVYRPTSLPAKLLPVMVWIHGGGFSWGSGNSDIYGPDYLMDSQILLVTFNYRLNIFGFFTTEDGVAKGNYGLLDQVLVLKWVKKNIQYFGGNPNCVTIFGQSAGGVSVSLHMLTRSTKGLFQRAITQSGATVAPWAVSEPSQKPLTDRIAKQVGCPNASSAALLECFRTKPANDLIRAIGPSIVSYRPGIDGDYLSAYPYSALKKGQFKRLPWLSGMVQDEGTANLPTLLADNDTLAKLAANDPTVWTQAPVVGAYGLNDRADRPLQVAGQIRQFYLGTRRIDPKDPQTLKPVFDVQSDHLNVVPQSVEMELAGAPHGTHSLHKYIIDHTGPGRMRFIEQLLGHPFPVDLGVSHLDDVAYLFRIKNQPVKTRGTPEHRMIRFFIDLWVSFATTGRFHSSIPLPNWPAFDSTRQFHMRLNDKPSVASKVFEKRIAFWKTLPIREAWRGQFVI